MAKSDSRIIPGINIQWPISTLILSGEKTIETRTYTIPAKHVGKELALIETPGPRGDFKARIRGIVTFGKSFAYEDAEAFYRDTPRHCVERGSAWQWQNAKPKHGWPITSITVFADPIPAPSPRGIVFASRCIVP